MSLLAPTAANSLAREIAGTFTIRLFASLYQLFLELSVLDAINMNEYYCEDSAISSIISRGCPTRMHASQNRVKSPPSLAREDGGRKRGVNFFFHSLMLK
jgi:hypothetical protein